MRLLALAAGMLLYVAVCPAQSVVTVVNYAGFTGVAPLGVGSIGSAYGSFGSVATTNAATLNPMPKEIAGLRLRVGGRDAPLYFVSAAQINFVVPVAIAPGRQTVEVVSGGDVIARGSTLIWNFGPGLAVRNPAPNSMQGIVQNANQNFATNGENARARKGETIVVYATGCGQTQPGLPDGAPPAQLSSAIAKAEVFVANDRAVVEFAGASSDFPGICQINAVVPDKAYINGQTPLYFTVNGIPSNQVSFWVE